MKQWVTASAVLGLWSLLAPAAWSQGYVPPPTSPFPRQPLSPYLNLLRGGNPAINYYGLVRPQQQFYSSISQLQQQVQQTQVNSLIVADPNAYPYTGHPTRFFNYSHYFFNQGGAGVVGGGGVGFPGAPSAGAPIIGTGPLPPLRSGGTPSQSRPGTSPLRTGP